ncbi:MAG: hypothetical protein ACI83W_002026 [Marinoscillum sp.]|jgi:hypothetical protein
MTKILLAALICLLTPFIGDAQIDVSIKTALSFEASSDDESYDIINYENLGKCEFHDDTLTISLINGDGLFKKEFNLSFMDNPLRIVKKSIKISSDVNLKYPEFTQATVVLNHNPFTESKLQFIGQVNTNSPFFESLIFRCYTQPDSVGKEIKIAGRDFFLNPEQFARLISDQTQVYQQSDIEGKVYIDFFIDKKGSPFKPLIVDSSHPTLCVPALKVINSLRYEPATNEGETVVQKMSILIAFSPNY